jgi:hypothetical protein
VSGFVLASRPKAKEALPKEMEAELRERAKILDTSLTNVIEVALDFYFRIEKIDQDL